MTHLTLYSISLMMVLIRIVASLHLLLWLLQQERSEVIGSSNKQFSLMLIGMSEKEISSQVPDVAV